MISTHLRDDLRAYLLCQLAAVDPGDILWGVHTLQLLYRGCRGLLAGHAGVSAYGLSAWDKYMNEVW